MYQNHFSKICTVSRSLKLVFWPGITALRDKLATTIAIFLEVTRTVVKLFNPFLAKGV